MSRHPSPGSSHPQIFQQVTVPASRQKSKAYATGIAAGAEDVKYQAKYKELRRKVKEIEADNDKLQFKVLQAKRSIQRMKLERAVLYERLSVVPPSPEMQDRNTLPPIHPGPGIPPAQQNSHGAPGPHHAREIRDQPSDANDFSPEFGRGHPGVRVVQGPDGRPMQISEAPMGPGIAPPAHPRSLSSRRSSGGHDSSRQLPPLPHLLPMHYDAPRGHAHQHPHSSPHMHPHPNSPHEHSRSRSRAHQEQGFHSGHPHPQQYPQESLPPVQHVYQTAPIGGERERSRRHHIHELTNSHSESPSHNRHQTVTSSPRAHSTDSRGGNRLHSHQRTGPGTYINRNDDHIEREVEREREREWEQSREHTREREAAANPRIHSPPIAHRSRQHMERPIEYQEAHQNSRTRDEQGYYHDGPRSTTPGSGSSGQGENLSRPDSRAQFYERNRYALRPVGQPNEDFDFVHEDGRSQSRDRGRGGGMLSPEQNRESRKRSRNDMEALEGESDVIETSGRVLLAGGGSGGGVGSERGAGSGESMTYEDRDRGSKRFHQDNTSDPIRGVADIELE